MATQKPNIQKCYSCGGEMTVMGTGRYHYTESGLPDVDIASMNWIACLECEERVVEIPKVKQLHQCIAWALITRNASFGADERYFLRKHLGLSLKHTILLGAEFDKWITLLWDEEREIWVGLGMRKEDAR